MDRSLLVSRDLLKNLKICFFDIYLKSAGSVFWNFAKMGCSVFIESFDVSDRYMDEGAAW
jgi:hypothetical protein